MQRAICEPVWLSIAVNNIRVAVPVEVPLLYTLLDFIVTKDLKKRKKKKDDIDVNFNIDQAKMLKNSGRFCDEKSNLDV